MKPAWIVLAMALTTSTAALADDCSSILGSFQCAYQGQQVPLTITRTGENLINVEVAGEGEAMTTDGVIHRSKTDDSTYMATCSQATGLQALYTFKSTTQSVSITKSANGVKYVMDRGAEKLSLDCAKK